MRKNSKPVKPAGKPSAKPTRATSRSASKPSASPTSPAKAAPAKRPATPRQNKAAQTVVTQFEYDVCTTFAGESRAYVEQVVTSLKRRRIRCFYDFDEQATLLGKNLLTYLDEVYRKRARFCVMFISKHYPLKPWTNHERQSVQARVFQGSEDYLIPVRLDDTEVPGVLPSVGYIDGRQHTPSQVAALIQAKIQGKPTPRALLSKPTLVKNEKAPEKQTKSERALSPSEGGGRRKVVSSGRWTLLGDAFYEATLVSEETSALHVHIAPKTPREEAELRALQSRSSWQRDTLRFAHGNNAERCRVKDVTPRSENGKAFYALALQPERDHSYTIEVAMSGLSADEIAEKRARLILLNEPFPSGKSLLDEHIIQGFGGNAFEAGVVAKVLKRLGGGTAYSSLQKARLEAIYQLKASGIIEHVLEFSLGPTTKSGLAVSFEGSRPAQGRSKGYIIRISGTLALADSH